MASVNQFQLHKCFDEYIEMIFIVHCALVNRFYWKPLSQLCECDWHLWLCWMCQKCIFAIKSILCALDDCAMCTDDHDDIIILIIVISFMVIDFGYSLWFDYNKRSELPARNQNHSIYQRIAFDKQFKARWEYFFCILTLKYNLYHCLSTNQIYKHWIGNKKINENKRYQKRCDLISMFLCESISFPFQASHFISLDVKNKNGEWFEAILSTKTLRFPSSL